MHIAEGILTGPSLAATLVAGTAVVAWGASSMKRFTAAQPERRALLGMAAAFIFMVSLVPLPAFTGTTTHPCGTPLAGILLGPAIAAGLAFLSLLLQAAFFAHGGFSSLGANTLNLGLLGAGSAWLVYKALRAGGAPVWAAAALGGLTGNLMTYAGAGGQLALHLSLFAPHPQYDLGGYLLAIYGAYLPTQIPIAIGEMIVTGWALHAISRRRPEVLENLAVERKGFSKSVAALLMILAMLPLTLLPATPQAQAATQPVASPAQQPENKPGNKSEDKIGGFVGMDEAVNERMAEKAGAPARDPYINTEAMGDLWNALLLLAGGLCGFVIGRYWHLLFGHKQDAA